MATKFDRMPKMMTTEPSADEVNVKGMKKGGRTKHMQVGGNPTMPMAPRRPVMPLARPTVMRKHGGKAEGGESKAEHKAEMHKMGKIEKELKHHEHMAASKAHRGLKKGGMAVKDNTPGGLLGGISATRASSKATTGDIEGPGYKDGGQALAAKGDRFETKTTLKPAIDVNDKVHEEIGRAHV